MLKKLHNLNPKLKTKHQMIYLTNKPCPLPRLLTGQVKSFGFFCTENSQVETSCVSLRKKNRDTKKLTTISQERCETLTSDVGVNDLLNCDNKTLHHAYTIITA